MAKRIAGTGPDQGVMRELAQSLALLALLASSVGTLVAMVVVATHVLAG